MPRRRTERKVGGHCRIRKRGSSSSTSSSSLLVRNYRLKRAILVGKRAGSSTPVPTWKMSIRSPSSARHPHHKGKDPHTSARRLGASLWEINGSQSPAAADSGEVDDFDGDQRCRKSRHALLDHCLSPLSKNKDGSKRDGHRRKSSSVSQKLQLSEYIVGGMDSLPNGNASMEGASHSGATAKTPTRWKDVNYSLAASKEIVKVLFRLWSQEEQYSSRLTLVSALRVEIDRARHQVDELIHEQRHGQRDMEGVLRQFAAEKAAWRSREEERVCDAVASMARELEIERKLRRQSERLNKRLGRELAEARVQLSKAGREIACERRAREALERTCEELARGVGEDRDAAVEAREEVEREREMLQLADVLREERVQMKLSDARYEFEEKNAALERLRAELEAYLGGGDVGSDKNKEFVEFLESMQQQQQQQCSEGEDSADSELHSIELNMDSLNKSYKWSFAREQELAESRRPSVDEVFKGRRSLSEQIQWENICLQRKTSDGIEWDFTLNTTRKQQQQQQQANDNGFDNASSSSRPESPNSKILQQEDHLDGNGCRAIQTRPTK